MWENKIRIYNWQSELPPTKQSSEGVFSRALNKGFMFEYNGTINHHEIVYACTKAKTSIKPNRTIEVEPCIFIRTLVEYLKETNAWPLILKTLSMRNMNFIFTNHPTKFHWSLNMVFRYLAMIKPSPRKPHLIRFLEKLQKTMTT